MRSVQHKKYDAGTTAYIQDCKECPILGERRFNLDELGAGKGQRTRKMNN